MNLLICSGSFKKVAYKEGQSFMFKLGIRRDYKNKTTGKYDYDNPTFYVTKYNENTIKFLNSYVKDGDTVEVQGHINTYATEKDGQKVYHEDHICDSVKLVSAKGGSNAETGNSGTVTESPIVEDSGFVEISDEDCPW